MMSHFSLSWTIGTGNHCRGGNKKYPDWMDIETLLERIRTSPGSVTLDVVDGPETGPQSLQVRSDQGNYLLTLGEADGEDYHVRSFTNIRAEPGQLLILGDLWDSRAVSTDFNIVRQAFNEFFLTGNVSQALLN